MSECIAALGQNVLRVRTSGLVREGVGRGFGRGDDVGRVAGRRTHVLLSARIFRSPKLGQHFAAIIGKGMLVLAG